MSSKPIYSDPKVTNTETFIQKANFIHGEKYDYSKVEYINRETPVVIICPVHGAFNQKPGIHTHKRASGCQLCSKDQTSSNGRSKKYSEFLIKAAAVHNNFYSYDKFLYTKNYIKSTITCPVHGGFEQTPKNHLHGCGCPKCSAERESKRRRSNKSEYIKKANKVHNNFYSYENLAYVGVNEKSVITCPLHGDFEQELMSHLKGCGCPECSIKSASDLKISNCRRDFTSKAELKHGVGRYNYSLVDYINAKSKVTIICPHHPALPFSMSPFNHLNGQGCPYCAREITSNKLCGMYRYEGRSITLYHIRIGVSDETFEKIGITSNTIERRFAALKNDGFRYEVISTLSGDVSFIKNLEQKILDMLNQLGHRYRVHHLKNSRTGGWTECFPCGVIEEVMKEVVSTTS